jgi:hypothetical protein
MESINLSTFQLPLIISQVSKILSKEDSASYSIAVALTTELNEDLKCKVCNEEIHLITMLSKPTIMRKKTDENSFLRVLYTFESKRNVSTEYTFNVLNVLNLLSLNKSKISKPKILEIIKSFDDRTLTINKKPMEYFINDLFFDLSIKEKEETAPAKQEEVKQEVKKLTKEEKKVLTEKLKKFYDANPSFKQENTTYFISSVKICETLILSGFTFEQIQEETLRNGKSFAYSKAVLTSNNNKVETKKQNEVVKINNNIFEDIF